MNRHTKLIRRIFQVALLSAVLIAGARYALGMSRTSIETYCPFGGLETALSLFTQKQFACAAGERNFALFVALLMLTFLARKSFCSWLCPVGTVSEFLTRAARRVFRKKRRDKSGHRLYAFEPSRRLDYYLRFLRIPVLILILYFTYRTGELIFRGYDPYYILFSFHGHDVRLWSYGVIALVLAAVFVFPMSWCRYLCPLGVSLAPFSAFGRFRIRRDSDSCNNCRACDKACLHSLRVSDVNEVKSAECTLCLECVSACKSSRSLSLKFRFFRLFSISHKSIPVMIIALTALGLLAARSFSVPSVDLEFHRNAADVDDKSIRSTEFIVDGVKCVDTALSAASTLETLEGVLAFKAFASYNRIIVDHDPATTDTEEIIEAIEGPVYDEETNEFYFNLFTILKVDGEDVDSLNRRN